MQKQWNSTKIEVVTAAYPVRFFSKFYRRHYELISKYNVGLKTLLSEGLSEPEFYGDLVYKGLESIRRDFGLKIREKIIESYFCELYSHI